MNYTKQQPESIQALFNTIAPRYDLTNSIMSFHLHALWNRKLAASILKTNPKNIIDLCSGTGEIAFRLIPGGTDIHLVDFSEMMLQEARRSAARLPEEVQRRLHFLQANVEELPYEDGLFSHASIAYGIRNVQNPKKCLQEMFRVLNHNGKASILELTRPKTRVLRALHSLYLYTALPLIGKLLTKNKAAYSYLQSSIKTFVDPVQLQKDALDVGFRKVTIEPLSFGVATLITMEK